MLATASLAGAPPAGTVPGGATRLLGACLVRSLVEVLVDVSPGPVRLPCPDLASLLDALLQGGVELAAAGPDGSPLWVGPGGLTAVLVPPLDWDDLVSRFDLPSSFWYDPDQDALWAGLGGGVLYGSGAALAPRSVQRAAPVPAGSAAPAAPAAVDLDPLRSTRLRHPDPHRGATWLVGVFAALAFLGTSAERLHYAAGADLVTAHVTAASSDMYGSPNESLVSYEFTGESRSAVVPGFLRRDEVGDVRTLLVHPDFPDEPRVLHGLVEDPIYPLVSAGVVVWAVRSRRSAAHARRDRRYRLGR